MRKLVQTLCQLTRLMFRPVVIRHKQVEVTEQVKKIMETLTEIMPRAEHSILIHACNHVVQQQYDWGVLAMFVFERVNNIIKNLITSRQHPEASLVTNYERTVQHLPANIAQSCLHAASGTYISASIMHDLCIFYASSLSN